MVRFEDKKLVIEIPCSDAAPQEELLVLQYALLAVLKNQDIENIDSGANSSILGLLMDMTPDYEQLTAER